MIKQLTRILLAVSLPMTTMTVTGQTLVKLWETEGLSNPESVVYDKATNSLYVSNVNGAPTEKDGNGFISRLSVDGEIIQLKWLEGFNAPKGLAIYNNKLYAADIDTLVEIDIADARITNTYQVKDAKFLNDVTADKNGRIYVSDMLLNRIHCLHNGTFSIWLESPDLQSPNGLMVEKNHLIVGTWGVMTDGFATDIPGHLKKITFKDHSISSIGDGSAVGNMDGVEVDRHGDYYATDWMAGKLYRISKQGQVDLLLSLEQGTADHEIIVEQDIILLPMMNTNKLLAYRLNLQ